MEIQKHKMVVMNRKQSIKQRYYLKEKNKMEERPPNII